MFKRKQPRVQPEPIPEEQSIQQQVVETAAATKRVEEMLGEGQTPFAQYMLENKNIPEQLKEIVPLFFDKEFALTNITPDEAWVFRLEFRNAMLQYFIDSPKAAFDTKTISLLQQMESLFHAKIMRATGQNFRERALYVTTIAAQERPEVKQVKGGILSNMKRKLL